MDMHTNTDRSVRTLGAGECFGEEILLGIMEEYDYTTTVKEKAKFEMLLEQDFLGIFSAMPNVMQRHLAQQKRLEELPPMCYKL